MRSGSVGGMTTRCLLVLLCLSACEKPAATPQTPETPAADSGAAPSAGEPPGAEPGADSGAAPAEPGAGEGGAKCGDETCTEGRECVSYYGIAGASGPQFHSCEWKCDRKQACPAGTTCTTIADGPGAVCR